MFKNGSFWKPPPMNRYTQCSTDESYERAKKELEIRKGNLTNELVQLFLAKNSS